MSWGTYLRLIFIISSKTLSAGAECRGLCLWLKAPAAKRITCAFAHNTLDGLSEEHDLVLNQASDEWQLLTLPITDKDNLDNLDNLELSPSITVEAWRSSPNEKALIDDVKLTSATLPYECQIGSSMPSPAVAGGAAVDRLPGIGSDSPSLC